MFGPGSFVACLNALKSILIIPRAEHSELPQQMSKTFLELSEKAQTASKNDLETMVENIIDDKKVFNVIWQALNLSGLEGKINVEKSPNDKLSIELINGFNFSLAPSFQIKKYSEKNVNTLIIDGMIESVAELNHVLQHYSEILEPLIIFARGFHEEIIMTLKTNFDRGTLKVIPVIVPFDEEGINLLNDLATVCGTNIISSNKAQLITAIKLDEIQKVQKLLIHNDTITIINASAVADSLIHVGNLIKKKNELDTPELGHLYDKRIKALTANYVCVRIPEGTYKYAAIETAITAVKSTIMYGYVKTDSLTENVFTSYLKQKNEKLPANTVVGVLKYSLECVNQLYKIGAMILTY
jgi:chaperonin GroEL (HSP60 family)